MARAVVMTSVTDTINAIITANRSSVVRYMIFLSGKVLGNPNADVVT